ncbi:unnamed protein product, partial [Durusdinium trenchii]
MAPGNSAVKKTLCSLFTSLREAPMATAAVTLHISPELQLKAPLSTALREAAEGRVTVEELESSAAPLPWALVQADFNYVSQWTVASAKDPFAPLGTRCAAALCFAEATQATSAVEALSAWWPSKAAECPGARLLLVLIGPKQASLRVDAAECLTEALLTLQMDFVEVRSAPLAAAYAVQCAESVAKSRGRALPSRFKVAGAKCQTLPKDPSDRLATTWVSQLMQVQGMSEEIAKVVAERFNSPFAFMEAVEATCSAHPEVVSTLGDRPWAGLYTSNVKTRPSNVKTGWVEKVPAVFQCSSVNPEALQGQTGAPAKQGKHAHEQCEDEHHHGAMEELRRCRKDGLVRCRACRQSQKRLEEVVGTRGLDLAAHFRSRQLTQRAKGSGVEVVASSPEPEEAEEDDPKGTGRPGAAEFPIDPAGSLRLEDETTDVPTSTMSPSSEKNSGSSDAPAMPRGRNLQTRGGKCLHIGCDVCARWFVVDQVLFDHWRNAKFTCCMIGETCSRKELHTSLVAVPSMVPQSFS